MADETTAAEHYHRLIDVIVAPSHPVTDPFFGEGCVRAWLEYAGGPNFFTALGDVRGLAVLKVGVGTGRMATKLLDRGCRMLRTARAPRRARTTEPCAM